MQDLKLSPFITEESISKRTKEIVKEIENKHPNVTFVAIGVLKGSLVFFTDFVRYFTSNVICEFIELCNYQEKLYSSGEAKLLLDLSDSIQDKHVILVEDIVDTGVTINYLKNILLSRQPKKLLTVSLLVKPDVLKSSYPIDYVGFEIPSDFVVGYGLDYQGYYRNLPYIAQLNILN